MVEGADDDAGVVLGDEDGRVEVFMDDNVAREVSTLISILEGIHGELITIRQAQVRTAVVLEAAFKVEEGDDAKNHE